MLVDSRASTVSAVGSSEPIPRGQMVRTARWKLAVYVGDQSELYDLENDPAELHNLFDDPAYVEIKQVLYQRMVEHMLTYTHDPSNYGYNQFPG
jgi:hypothetical protein